jgi:hypothetical protein
MSNDDIENEKLVNAINHLTEKLSVVLLDEFLQLPDDQQKNIDLIKATQLLLANVLCQVAVDKPELDTITDLQADELKELISDCIATGFADKFSQSRH